MWRGEVFAISDSLVHNRMHAAFAFMNSRINMVILTYIYNGPEMTWSKYILTRYSDLLSHYVDLTKSL